MKNAADWALLIFAILVFCFCLTYAFRSPWWTNRIGKIYLVKSGILSLVLIQITLATWLSTEYTGRQALRLFIYSLGIVSYLVLEWALIREQNEDRRRKREEREKRNVEEARED